MRASEILRGVGRGRGRLALGAALLVVAVLALGSRCSTPFVTILSPAPGSTVTTFDFTVEIRIAASADESTLQARLNGQPLALQGGPELFTAAIQAGPPLQDANELRVRVEDAVGVGFAHTAHFDYLPGKARARRVTDPSELPQGPLAQGEVGDWLLENGAARFVIQDAPRRELHSVGQYGGNLIDAELKSVPGRESFFELQPAVNIETVINAQTVEVVNDGEDGLTAVVRSCGPDDLIDYVNPSSVVAEAGGNFPSSANDQDAQVFGCTEYRLEPGASSLEISTTLENLTSQELPLYVGDYVNGMGSLEQWSSLVSNGVRLGIGEVTATDANRFLTYFGFDGAEGTSYTYVNPQPPDVPTPSSSFTQTGVSFVLHGHSIPLVLFFGQNPTFSVPANGAASFVRQFGVGPGSGADAVELRSELQQLSAGTLRGCVTVGGAPAPGARVAAGVDTSGGTTALQVVRAHWVTDGTGCYEGRVPAGSYLVAAAKEGVPYEGGGSAPALHTVTVPSEGIAVQDVALPDTARLRVEVSDASGAPLPARVGVVGFDPSPPALLTASLISSNDTTTGIFDDPTRDRVPFGLTRTEYAGASGVLELDVEPGPYTIAVSRGSEYSLYTEDVTLTAGSTHTVTAQLARVVDTAGFIGSDYHVHMINSPDSRVGLENRALSFAGEGVENLIATDHDALTDVGPTLANLGLGGFVHATVGEEITTFDTGHYNAYPQGRDPARAQTGGSTDWAGAAPAGQDFPSLGHFILSPAEIESAVLGDPDNAGHETVVQVNHIDSHFGPLRIDTSVEPPASFISGASATEFRLDPSVANFFHPFAALELWNGATDGAQSEFLDQRIGIWMNLLNQGIPTTAIADTDSHTFHNLRTGGARTWTPSSTDDPAAIVEDEVGQAVKAGKAVGGQGVYVQTRLRVPASGATADHGLGTPTLVTTPDGAVDLEIEVQAPLWAPYDTIEVYANAATTVAQSRDGVPVLFSAQPTQVLQAGTDFSVSTVNVAPTVPGGERLETSHTVPLTGLTEDTWVVVVVRGTSGSSPPMFPAFPSSIDPAENGTLADLRTVGSAEAGTRALGFANALYVDVGGDGVFDAPGVQVASP